MRAVIRCKAKQHLLKETDWLDAPVCMDDVLIKDLTTVLFQSREYQALYAHCRTRAEADQIDDQMAEAIATRYRQIRSNQQNPLIQSLNQLL